MILWTFVSLILVIGTILEGNRRGWTWPQYNSIETLAVLWFAFSLGMYLIDN